MKTKRYLTLAIIGIGFAGLILTGCKKKDTPATDSDVTAAEDESNASYALQDSKNASDGAAMNNGTNYRTTGVYPIITKRDTTIGSQIDSLVDINFGPVPYVCPDGRSRQGNIYAYWVHAHPYITLGDTINMTFGNYKVTTLNGNTIGVSGFRSLVNSGKDSAGDCTWSFNANLSLTYASGGTATWVSSRTNTLENISGNWYYSITGSASGVTRKGVAYTITITTPLIHTAWWLSPGNRCDCFESGEVEISRTGKPYPLYLTFTSGIGNCKHTATATINGNNYNIVLP